MSFRPRYHKDYRGKPPLSCCERSSRQRRCRRAAFALMLPRVPVDLISAHPESFFLVCIGGGSSRIKFYRDSAATELRFRSEFTPVTQ